MFDSQRCLVWHRGIEFHFNFSNFDILLPKRDEDGPTPHDIEAEGARATMSQPARYRVSDSVVSLDLRCPFDCSPVADWHSGGLTGTSVKHLTTGTTTSSNFLANLGAQTLLSVTIRPSERRLSLTCALRLTVKFDCGVSSTPRRERCKCGHNHNGVALIRIAIRWDLWSFTILGKLPCPSYQTTPYYVYVPEPSIN